jgi:DNA polymerase-1
MGPRHYSLSALTFSYENEILECKKMVLDRLKSGKVVSGEELRCIEVYEKYLGKQNIKQNMQKLFIRNKKLKSGESGKMLEIPSIIEMHTNFELVEKWVNYATLDAEITFWLRETLIGKLVGLKIDFEGMNNCWELYNRFWLDFGELLTDIERSGFQVDLGHLKKAEESAEADILRYQSDFKDWVTSIQDGTEEFNPSSTQQLQQLLYAPFKRKTTPKKPPKRAQPSSDPSDDADHLDIPEDHQLSVPLENQTHLRKLAEKTPKKSDKLDYFESEEPLYGPARVPRSIDQIDFFEAVRHFRVENNINYIEDGKDKPLKYRQMAITGLGLPVPIYSLSGLPSVDVNA